MSAQAATLAASQPSPVGHHWPSWRPRQALRRSPRATAGVILVALIVIVAALAPVIGRYDPTYGDFANILAAPTFDHPAGTDGFGRDVLVRVLYGYRVSIVVAVVSALAAVVLGIPLGLLAGYFGGVVDNLIMRPLDLLMAFPAILL